MTWEEVAKETFILNQLWKPIIKKDPPQEIFPLDENTALTFQLQRAALDKELDHLNKLVDCADRENMALSSQKIGSHLEKMIGAFAYTEEADVSFVAR